VLFLASGGGSALLELPADPATSLDELRACYRGLVGSGADIVDLNIVRRHLSAVKGGRLALAAAGAAAQLTVEISDVPEREHALVASGPSHPDVTSPADALLVLDRHRLWAVLPAGLAVALRSGELPPRLEPSSTTAAPRSFATIGDNLLARACMGRELDGAGVLVVDDTTCARARRAGFDAGVQLAAAAAFPLLAAIGDAVITGPSGTNVRDLRVLLAGG
jgi:hydroxypyruvate reductase